MYSELETVEQRYARALSSLYLHAAIYLLVNTTLYVVSATVNSTTLLVWVATIWGFGLAGHAITVLAATPEDYQQMFAHRYRRAVQNQSTSHDDAPSSRSVYAS